MSREDQAGSRAGAVLAVAATAAVYLLAGLSDFGFVNYDDPLVVHENPVTGWGSLGAAFTELMANAWLPLYALSTAMDNLLFGAESPGAYHLHSLAWHCLNVLLVWLLARRLGLGPTGAAAGALLFGLHPAVTESVAWVASRKDLVSFAFAAGAALVYLDAEGTERRPGRHLLGAALLGLGMMAKGTVVVLPGLLALHALARKPGDPRRRESLLAVIPYAVVALVLTAVHVAVARDVGTMCATAASGDGIVTRVVA
ncbi:MAG: glycosyltransferase family 39 protein, partial [Planctomycetota bacterium]